MNTDAGSVKGTKREVPREFHQLGAITSPRLKGKEKKGILVHEPLFLLDAKPEVTSKGAQEDAFLRGQPPGTENTWG